MRQLQDRNDDLEIWVSEPNLGRLQPRQETTVEALEIAIRTARLENRLRHANALDDLRAEPKIKLSDFSQL
jgi:hypothetical protein